MKENEEIQQKIREERIKQGISVRRLAEMADCTARAVVYWEGGKREISVNIADRILKVLGITVEIG